MDARRCATTPAAAAGGRLDAGSPGDLRPVQREHGGPCTSSTPAIGCKDLIRAARREPPPQRLTRARTLAGYPDETVLLPLPVLALMIGVHVRTLHAAARSGRLGVAYDTRTTFRRLRPRATLKHALDFRRHYYGTQRRPARHASATDLGLRSRGL